MSIIYVDCRRFRVLKALTGGGADREWRFGARNMLIFFEVRFLFSLISNK